MGLTEPQPAGELHEEWLVPPKTWEILTKRNCYNDILIQLRAKVLKNM